MNASEAAGFRLGATTLVLPDALDWRKPPGAPDRSYESCYLWGDQAKPGPYLALMRWHPGYMSAPHTYLTDRLAYVLSGTWWVGDGEVYDVDACKAIPAGSFVHRPAGTAHFDGVIGSASEPAVIAVSGLAPLGLVFTQPDQPGLRPA